MHSKEKIVEDILKQLKPDRDALLKLISSKITDDILFDIASTDYGWKAEENIIALRKLKSTYTIPTTKELDYEVLCLCRYTEPDDYPTLNTNGLHLKRALSCVMLLISDSLSGDDYRYDYLTGPEYNLIQLIESVNYLGKDYQLALIAFLSWKFNTSNKNGIHSFFDDEGDVNDIVSIFALIYLLLKISYNIEEKNLKILTELLIEGSIQSEKIYNQHNIYKGYHNTGFLGLLYLENEKDKYRKWIKLAKEIPSLITHLKDQDLINQLTEISVLISKNEHLYKND